MRNAEDTGYPALAVGGSVGGFWQNSPQMILGIVVGPACGVDLPGSGEFSRRP